MSPFRAVVRTFACPAAPCCALLYPACVHVCQPQVQVAYTPASLKCTAASLKCRLHTPQVAHILRTRPLLTPVARTRPCTPTKLTCTRSGSKRMGAEAAARGWRVLGAGRGELAAGSVTCCPPLLRLNAPLGELGVRMRGRPVGWGGGGRWSGRRQDCPCVQLIVAARGGQGRPLRRLYRTIAPLARGDKMYHHSLRYHRPPAPRQSSAVFA